MSLRLCLYAGMGMRALQSPIWAMPLRSFSRVWDILSLAR